MASTRRARLDSLVAAMHVEYLAGASLSQLARKHGRVSAGVRELFERRGLYVRPANNRPSTGFLPNGQIRALVPYTPEQITALIVRTKRFSVPREIQCEWRAWSLAKRGDFVRRLRAHLRSPYDRPTAPFSQNVEPFEYGSILAHTLMAAANAGRSSQTKSVQIRLCSQGVIWRGQLWFWVHKTGYVHGPWTPELGRPILHIVIWQDATGCKLPPACVVRFVDGNKNNLAPENLTMMTRNEMCRENQAASLIRSARASVGALLNRHQSPESQPHSHLLHELH